MKFLILFSFLVSILFSVLTGFAQPNLISNGGFESGTTGWTVMGATLTNTTDAHSGNSAAKVSNRKNMYDAINKDITSIIKSGQAYTLSAWVKIPSPAVNLRATIALNVDGVTTWHGYFWTNSPVIGSYQQYSEKFTLKWTGNLVSANLYFETESVGGIYSDYIIDDVQMVEHYTIPDSVLKAVKGLKDIKSSMLVGGCVTEGNKNYFTSDEAKAQALKDCNTVTVMCYPLSWIWDAKPHVYHVDDFTNRVREMKKQNLTVKAHMLLGSDNYFVDWFQKGDFPVDTLDAIMKSWLKGIIQYKGNDTLVDIWNVVNESISWDGKGGYWPLSAADKTVCEFQRMGFEPDASGLTGTMYVNSQHPVYIRKAFEYARSLTKKKLELRDATFEFPGESKYDAFYQLAVHLKNMKTPVDIIGFQAHVQLEKSYDWVGFTNNIKRYVQLGYEVHLTEVDIADVAKNWTEEKAELQKLQYYRLVTAAIMGGASDFQTWGFIDGDGWRPAESAFPYTNNYEPKPAYYGIKEALTDMSSILFWEMEAPANNIMPDVMKYNNFGTMKNFGAPVIVDGFKSKALKFDGIDDYISSPALLKGLSGDFTFSCFIKTATTKAGVIADLALNDNSGLKIGLNTEGRIYFDGTAAGLNEKLMGNKAVNDDTWHFVAVQRDSTAYRLYIDDSAPVASKSGNITMFNKLVVGAKPNGNEPFAGEVDEVKLYDTAIEEASFIRCFVPQGPLKLTYVSSHQKITLTWTDQSTDEAGFVIERKTEDGNWMEIGKVGANVLTFNNEAELFSTKYYYRVSSFSKLRNSVPTNTVIFTTPAAFVPWYWYPFNGNARDESGNDHHGTPVGAALTTDMKGIVDRAFYFDGIDDKIVLGKGSELINNSDSFSIMAWIYPQDLNLTDSPTILGEREGGNNYQLCILNHRLYFSFWSNGAESMFTGSEIFTNQWTFITVTYDGQNVKFFINGQLDKTFPAAGKIDSNPSTLNIGSWDGSNGWFKGKLDEIAFYNKTLTPEEILTIYRDNPSDILLSNASIEENQPSGKFIGKFTTTDPDVLYKHAYSLIDGSGSEGNSFFIIKGDTLCSNKPFNYESINSYSIRVRTNLRNNGVIEKIFQVSVLDVIETGIGEIEEADIKIYPQPSDGIVFVEAPGWSKSAFHVQVYDMQGSIVYQELHRINSSVCRVDLSACSKGMYIVKVITDKSNLVRKLLIE